MCLIRAAEPKPLKKGNRKTFIVYMDPQKNDFTDALRDGLVEFLRHRENEHPRERI